MGSPVVAKDASEAVAQRLPLRPKGSPMKLVVQSDIDFTELGNARRFVRKHGNDVRFCFPWKRWLVWDGKRWANDDAGRALTMAKGLVDDLFEDVAKFALLKDADLVKRTTRHAQASAREPSIAHTLGLAKDDLAILPDALDADPWLLNVTNGTVDLRTGELRAHRRADHITHLVPHRFDPAATCPRWEKFLGEVMLDRADISAFLSRWFGYCLTGQITEHALVFAVGGGRNGKGVTLETIRHVMGEDLVVTAPPKLLLASKQERHPAELIRLKGCRLVIASEVPKSASFDEERVKSLTGGDTISARGMGENFTDFRPTHKFVLCANHKPRAKDTSIGFWSRMRVVPFDACFRGREDLGLTEALKTEAEGILAWMVRGAVQWAASGLGAPAEVAKATEAYQAEEDVVGRFLAEREYREWTSTNDIFADLTRWAEDLGEKSISKKALATELDSRGWKPKQWTGRGRGWVPPHTAYQIIPVGSDRSLYEIPTREPTKPNRYEPVSGMEDRSEAFE